MNLQLHNPDGLPVEDPIEQSAREILWRNEVAQGTAASTIFCWLWRRLGGRPGKMETSLGEIYRNNLDAIASLTTVRYGLNVLIIRGLVTKISGRERHRELVLGVMMVREDRRAKQTIIGELANERPRRMLTIIADSPAQRDLRSPTCAVQPAQRTSEPTVAELETMLAQRRQQDAAQSSAGEKSVAQIFLGRPFTSPLNALETVPEFNVPLGRPQTTPPSGEGTRDGQRCASQGDGTAVGDKLLGFVEDIDRALAGATLDEHCKLTAALAWHYGLLSENDLAKAQASTKESGREPGAYWWGIIRKKLIEAKPEDLQKAGLWDHDQPRVPYLYDELEARLKRLEVRWHRPIRPARTRQKHRLKPRNRDPPRR